MVEGEMMLPLKGGLVLHGSLLEKNVLQFSLLQEPRLLSKASLQGSVISIAMASPLNCELEQSDGLNVLRVGHAALIFVAPKHVQRVKQFLADVRPSSHQE